MNTITPDSDDLAIKSYNKKNLNRLKKRRKIRRLKILLARLRILARIASYVLLIWGFLKITGLPCWYLNENIFVSYPGKYLEIEGYNIVSTNQIIKKLQEITLPKKPLYLIDTSLIEKNL